MQRPVRPASVLGTRGVTPRERLEAARPESAPPEAPEEAEKITSPTARSDTLALA